MMNKEGMAHKLINGIFISDHGQLEAVDKVTKGRERSFASFVFCLQGLLDAVVGRWQNTHSAQDDIFMHFFNSPSLSNCQEDDADILSAMIRSKQSSDKLSVVCISRISIHYLHALSDI
jgi:hypothetical protein